MKSTTILSNNTIINNKPCDDDMKGTHLVIKNRNESYLKQGKQERCWMESSEIRVLNVDTMMKKPSQKCEQVLWNWQAGERNE